MTTQELDKLAHSLAYEHAECLVRSDAFIEHDDSGVWHDIGAEGEGPEKDVLEYLEARGLLEHHELNARWVRVREESEAARP